MTDKELIIDVSDQSFLEIYEAIDWIKDRQYDKNLLQVGKIVDSGKKVDGVTAGEMVVLWKTAGKDLDEGTTKKILETDMMATMWNKADKGERRWLARLFAGYGGSVQKMQEYTLEGVTYVIIKDLYHVPIYRDNRWLNSRKCLTDIIEDDNGMHTLKGDKVYTFKARGLDYDEKVRPRGDIQYCVHVNDIKKSESQYHLGYVEYRFYMNFGTRFYHKMNGKGSVKIMDQISTRMSTGSSIYLPKPTSLEQAKEAVDKIFSEAVKKENAFKPSKFDKGYYWEGGIIDAMKRVKRQLGYSVKEEVKPEGELKKIPRRTDNQSKLRYNLDSCIHEYAYLTTRHIFDFKHKYQLSKLEDDPKWSKADIKQVVMAHRHADYLAEQIHDFQKKMQAYKKEAVGR